MKKMKSLQFIHGANSSWVSQLSLSSLHPSWPQHIKVWILMSNARSADRTQFSLPYTLPRPFSESKHRSKSFSLFVNLDSFSPFASYSTLYHLLVHITCCMRRSSLSGVAPFLTWLSALSIARSLQQFSRLLTWSWPKRIGEEIHCSLSWKPETLFLWVQSFSFKGSTDET